jgi:hypothetical protein
MTAHAGLQQTDTIARLIMQLCSDQFQQSEATSQALEAIGETALEALEQATRGSADVECQE